MYSKRISALIMLSLLFLTPVLTFLSALNKLEDWPVWEDLSFGEKGFVQTVEELFQENLPVKKELEQLALTIKLRAGQVEQDNIFILEDMLLENIQPPVDAYVNDNTRAILRFVEKQRVPTYAMLIPTACAIKQKEVPEFAPLYNQKSLIESVYNQFSGQVTTVDVYPTLFDNSDQYIYYKTHANLTGLGGYYLYTALGRRLGISLRGLDKYEIEHVNHSFYGNIYERSPYKEVPADIITLYRFSKNRREYQVTHINEKEQKVYYTLYPEFTADLGDPMNVYFGGRSPVVDIQVASSYTGKLLIFADDTVISYLPFLLVEYGQITVVDLETISTEQLAGLDISGYDQVLFGYSVDSFMHSSQISRIDELFVMQ